MLIRVFGNMCESHISSGSLAFNGTGKFSSVTDEVLDYLKSLHISHVWYTGVIEHATCEDFSEYGIPLSNPLVIKGMAGSPYAINDYYDVNSYLADNPNKRLEEFINLVSRTHSAGLKVIIDFVPNHIARSYHQDSQEARSLFEQWKIDYPKEFSDENFYILKDNFSCKNFIDNVPAVQKELYVKRNSASNTQEFEYLENPAKATGNNCFSSAPGYNDWYETIKLNYGVDYLNGSVNNFYPIPDTWLKMKDILLFWLRLGVDGFRVDMAEMVPVEFWNYAIGEVKKLFPESIFIAEVYNISLYNSYLSIGKFDYLYDKEGFYDNLKSIAQSYSVPATTVQPSLYTPEGRLKGIKASNLTSCWQSLDKIQNKMLNFLENHDEQRVASDFNLGNGFAAIPELVVSLFFNKAPFMLYFGQEFGERGMLAEGYSGRDGRTSIFDWCTAPSVVRFLNGKLEQNEKDLLKIYEMLLNYAMNSTAVVNGDSYDLTYCQQENNGFVPYSQFVFARISRLDIDKPKAPREVVIVAVDFSMKGVERIFIPKHFINYASLQANRQYQCCWLGDSEIQPVGGYNNTDTIVFMEDDFISMKTWDYGVSILKINIDSCFI